MEYSASMVSILFWLSETRKTAEIFQERTVLLYMMSYWMEDYLPADDICMVNISERLGRVPLGSLKILTYINSFFLSLHNLIFFVLNPIFPIFCYNIVF